MDHLGSCVSLKGGKKKQNIEEVTESSRGNQTEAQTGTMEQRWSRGREELKRYLRGREAIERRSCRLLDELMGLAGARQSQSMQG